MALPRDTKQPATDQNDQLNSFGFLNQTKQPINFTYQSKGDGRSEVGT